MQKYDDTNENIQQHLILPNLTLLENKSVPTSVSCLRLICSCFLNTQQKLPQKLMHHTKSLFTVFLVKQFLDLLSKDDFLPHAVNIIVICQVKRIKVVTPFKIKFLLKNVCCKTFCSTHRLLRRRPSSVK